MPDEARDGQNVALNYQVNCWCAQLSKGTILYYQLSMPNNFHNKHMKEPPASDHALKLVVSEGHPHFPKCA